MSQALTIINVILVFFFALQLNRKKEADSVAIISLFGDGVGNYLLIKSCC